ncbi:MAG TPA: universal stress protein [Candidatus Binatia bacterium]|nr:universal stress protein [Candidatus Binatia bacterium]
MTQLKKILIPTDLSGRSRRGLTYAFHIAEGETEFIVLHVADEFQAWELYSDEMAFVSSSAPTWPLDRVVQEATLDLNQFLQKHLKEIRHLSTLRKKVVLGDVVEKIVETPCQEEVDLIVVTPRPHGALRRFFLQSVTDRVRREAPCPVLTVSQQQPPRPRRGKLVPAAFLPLHQERAGA